jgi:hypothetical protein
MRKTDASSELRAKSDPNERNFAHSVVDLQQQGNILMRWNVEVHISMHLKL